MRAHPSPPCPASENPRRLCPGARSQHQFPDEWPPYSGQKREFPEVDRAAFFNLEEAQKKIIPAQAAFVQELLRKLNEKA